MDIPRVIAFVAIALTFVLNTHGAPQQWSQWRGPRASGVDDSSQLPTKWNVESGENVLWRAPIPGLAHASPVTWNDRIYVATAVKPGQAELKVGLYGSIDSVNEKETHQWRLLALDRVTGKIIWNQVAHEGIPRIKRHTKASQCNSTPATDGSNIVAIFGSEGLFCFDQAGKLRWRKDLGPMDAGWVYNSSSVQWGFASSPIIHNGLVIVQCDVLSEQYVAAFRIEDGREVWRARRDEVGTWSTPTIETAEGRQQVILNGYKQTAGYDLENGKERWRLSGGGDIPVPTPVLAHGLVYLTSAHGKHRPMRAIRPDAKGDITPASIEQTNSAIVWTHPRQGSYMQTPIVVGDLLYGCHDTGVLTCFDARTGNIHYGERLAKGGGFTASPVSDGRHLYFTGELGDVYVVPVGTKFSVAATNTVGEICMTTPAISGGTLLFRTRGHVLAIGSKK